MAESFQHIQLIMVRKHYTLLMVPALIIAFFFIVRNNFTHINSFISITNTRWQKVHIQIREASDQNSDKLIFDQYLVKGQTRAFSIDNANNILYRRDLNPNHADGVHFTSWIPAKSGDSSLFKVDNP
jgi:hypothetical protein